MTTQDQIKSPPLSLFISEHWRVFFDLRKSYSFLDNYSDEKVGDGHPVLVIPGFMASPTSTRRLRLFLQKIGYHPYDWGLGRNYAKVEDLQILEQSIDKIYEKHQGQLTLIGWSLGGVYARELAKLKSEKIRQVITMAAPFAGINQPNNAQWLYRLISRYWSYNELDQEWIARLPEPAPVPSTALYSKKDGIVPWQVCMEQAEDKLHQNIEVSSSHMGMGFDPLVWTIIADRLSYQKGNWRVYSSQNA
ncbi:MAG: alpha/beta hydrolase [Bacteroidota bacterium]